jgi:myo-inositol catabolism protein IolC
MAGEIDDDTAVARMADTYAGLIRAWDRASDRQPSNRTRGHA